MSSRLRPLDSLQGEQLRASDPADLVWLSASAGTGKTHVLTARVLRLLLSGVAPETILCLTFTKAGAAEMADRIHARLAHWVRLDGPKLAKELFALGESHDPDAIRAARKLFAQVLDAPGGGLRIQTIHAFCQTLLAGFPAEAGLTPGFRPLEGREQAALARQTLAEMLVDAESGGDFGLIDDMRTLSLRLGEEKAEAYLRRCAREAAGMEALGVRQGIEARIRSALDVPLGDVEQQIVLACSNDAFDIVGLRAIAAYNAQWGTGRALPRVEIIARWIDSEPAIRSSTLADLHSVWCKKDGDPIIAKGWVPPVPGYAELALRLHEYCSHLLGLRARAQLAALISAGLRAGQAFALAYAEAKRSAGRVDFDDLIRFTARLLQSEGIGEWVRFKLDQSTDHILVDEAQDTNVSQWEIVAGLAGEFFAGEGAKGSRHRTIFTVGDFKQAIFGFQGTNPDAFRAASQIFSAKAAQAEREFLQLSLDRSFRSTPPILELVDQLIEEMGADTMGVEEHVERHLSARAGKPGQVTLWRPIAPGSTEAEDDDGEEGWIDDSTRAMATRLAQQIRQWIDEKLWITGRGRPLRPEDILILVRKRGNLASLIVARLHAEGVPVAGVDRLRLNAPLGIRDLLSAARFALQPEDDLNLAGLLVSPLIGWSQEQLYAVGFGRKGSLWRAIRDYSGEGVSSASEALHAILAMADFNTPHRFFEQILSGPLQGRRNLLERLGEEARDPVEELLNAALGFEQDATPTLQRFLDWFDRGEVEITRDPSAPADAVRVMTVHGSKGLQAPLVILADATADPDNARQDSLDWSPGNSGKVPVLRPKKEERCAPLDAVAETATRREMEEHWRLLYVALTRAEERLVIGGALGRRAKEGNAPQKSWHQAVEKAMETLGAVIEDDPRWGGVRHYLGADPVAIEQVARKKSAGLPAMAEPSWLRLPAPPEARPPRPLAPSAIGVDLVSDPPPGPAMLEAARRGKLLHALFERLPPVPPELRKEAGIRWLTRSAGLGDAVLAANLTDQVCAIMDDPRFTPLFAPDSLAEAPIAAVVGTEVIVGTVDRLLVTEERILVVDFKTGRRVPASLENLPEHHVMQMAAYVAALETIFPGRPIEAALLYTSGPKMFTLSPEALRRTSGSGD